MIDYFETAPEEHIRKEKSKAQRLKKTQWWKRRCAKGICYFCGRSFPPSELTMDHIIPLIRGGKTVKGNVVPACKECNSKKKYLLPIEWEEYMTKLSEGNWG
jgi:5-methylcytosine-specific restriction endonuclease McrA